MPRQARKKSRSGVYHIMLRGINKQTIFEDDEDRERFVYTLLKYKKKFDYELYAYCLMDNHVHLLLKEKELPLSELIKRISSSYVYWYNAKYVRCGHLFQGRFRSETVETTSSFLRVLRYIHQNPMKAGLVTDIFQNKWTSIHDYLNDQSLLNTSNALQLFSNKKSTALNSFIDYMTLTNDDQYLDEFQINRITDDDVRRYLQEIGIMSNSMLQRMDKEQRNVILAELKKLKGVSNRQISRITGISSSVIQRVR
jgi:putative transposase